MGQICETFDHSHSGVEHRVQCFFLEAQRESPVFEVPERVRVQL